MSIILQKPKIIILHVPKAGGTWVFEAIKAARIYHQIWWNKHGQLKQIATTPGPVDPTHCFKMAFVRHPVSWISSYFRFREGSVNGWDPFYGKGIDHPTAAIDSVGADSNHKFSKFVELYLERMPGWISKMFMSYVDYNEPGAPRLFTNFVGKQENLTNDLVYGLQVGGCELTSSQREAMRALTPQNVSAWKPLSVTIPLSLEQQLCDAEALAMNTFGY